MRSVKVVHWGLVGALALALAAAATLFFLEADRVKGAGVLAGMCCALGVAGVMGLGWRLHVMTHAVTSTLERLGPLGALTPLPSGAVEALHSLLTGHIGWVNRLHEQVADLQIQTQVLHRQRRGTESILSSLHDAVLVTDEQDRLVLANPAGADLFGLDMTVHLRRPLAEALGPQHRSTVELMRQGRQGQFTRGQIEFKSDTGCRVFDAVASGLRDEGGLCGVVVVLREVTREKEISQIKSDFVSYVSHELKTPLASITAYAEMLLDNEADDEAMRREFCEVIQGQAKRLNRLIEEILNLSRIESGLIPVQKERVSLAILVEEQVRMLQSYAEDRSVRMIGQKPIVYDQVYADKDMMSQVIVNLLSNAVKYNTPGGSVTVETEVDEAAGVVRVSVTDTGAGIPAEELGRIFDKFYRSKVNADRAEGTGLGLNLVKQIVEKLHGGRVFVRSQVGAGSTFGFELSLATRDMAVGRYSRLEA